MSDISYEPSIIESKWQRVWAERNCFKVEPLEGMKKYYLLEMLPYPSGRIHMGHVRNYTIGDVAARYRMMNGFKVLHPMGWDAFGMPAENAAIKHGTHPAKWTYENIEYMKGQLKRLGFSYDWEREFATCDPTYYRWEQLVFLRMYERGWVYKKTSRINWCPTCTTVLANEQSEGGVCWRCDSQVELKSMSQWYFRLTDYAEELLRDIDDKLDGWPERVRTMQREWIRKSLGCNIEFEIEGRSDKIKIFTTRPDTIYGATFMSLAYDHPLVAELSRGTAEEKSVAEFADRSAKIDRMARLAGNFEKDGAFVGAYCKNPVTGLRMPIFAANFVLMEYGTGAVMAVPAHDQRDFEFAKKYRLPIKVVIQPSDKVLVADEMEAAWEEGGQLVDSSEFTGLDSKAAIDAIAAEMSKMKIGGPTVTYHLKDWCLSRQRYWGAPIPIIYCDECGTVPVLEKDLPVILPQDVALTGEGGSPLLKAEKFVNCRCPKCDRPAKRETDTMDTFVESSWYMLRYASPKYDKGPVDPKLVKYWLPIDQYIGGIEHAVGHLIYFRYFTKVLRDLGFIELDEPVKNLMTQGMVYKDGAKMSKSKGNVIDPDDMIAKYGADTVRLFMLFAAPPEKDLEWSMQGIEGASRFIGRFFRLIQSWIAAGSRKDVAKNADLDRMIHVTIKRVTEDIERWHFNTAIAAIMEFVNFLYGLKAEEISHDAIETLVLLVSPLAPHVAEELWQMMGKSDIALDESWPIFDPSKIASDLSILVVQVNGKLRDKMEVASDIDEAKVTALALASDKVSPFLNGKPPKKIIYVPGKLLNIVANS